MNDYDIIGEAFPSGADGPLCAHCGEHRPGYLMLCVRCWDALSAFVKIEVLRADSRLEKAQIILDSRPRTP